MRKVSSTLLVLLLTAYVLPAQTKWVTMPGAPTTGGGHAWADPIDLQTAINTAVAGDSVFAAQGTYQLAATQSFTMKSGVKIYGGFAGTESTLTERDLTAAHTSTLRGDGASVVKNNNNGLTATAILDGFTITNGSARSGGGVYNYGASPTISNCIISSNSGGGMYNQYAQTTILKCVFTSNNSNTFYQRGGGVTNFNADGVNIINCVFIGNRGYSVGGVWAQDADYRDMVTNIVNCTFDGNGSINTVGAIYFDGSRTSQVKNCIIWGNDVGIRTASDHGIGRITNNIIQGGYLFNWHINPLFVNSSNAAGPDNIWGTADDGLRLQAGSPAFDNGTPNTAGLPLPATDMGGTARLQGGRIDMGAYEGTEACLPFTTLHVDSSVTASGNGGTWTTAFKTLDEALIAASRCTNIENIYVAKGTYQPPAGSSFSMMQHVKMYGGFPGGGGNFSQRDPAAYTTTLKGNNSSVIYNYTIDGTALLDGFTITGGRALYGGGIFNRAASPTINNCVFSNNETYMQSPSVGGGSGGGIHNFDGSNCIISHCRFTGNKAINTGGNGGGAILNSGSSPLISHCIFTNNTGAYGGAIYNASGTGVNYIANSVFAGNAAASDGGAIANANTTTYLTNVTFVNNTAGGGGGAIDNWNATIAPGNSIFWGNTASNYPDIWHESGTLNISYSLTQTALTGTGNIQGSGSPFTDIANPAGADGIWNNLDDGLRLSPGSAAINAGIPDTTGLGLGNTDLAGNARIMGTAIDLGAYEYDIAALPITLTGFNGNLYNGIAHLQWTTAEESNFSHFEIEKSTDGVLYRTLGELTGKGSYSSYTFSTPQQEPMAYYRLKQVDIDHDHEYSRILTLSQRANNSMQVYPNPATSYVNIQVANAGSMAIYTADGQLIRTLSLRAGINTVDITEWHAGLYYGVLHGVLIKLVKK